MAALLQADSRRLYSWWWDSHISPKHSKWLQENLADMDAKVRAMIKLIEEDADSFARRAEMFYEKRPELMKLVEEFYRAYRALAERYDHATGELYQAHRTMVETFPNQISFTDSNELRTTFSEMDFHTPEMAHPVKSLRNPDDFQKNSLILHSCFDITGKDGASNEGNQTGTCKQGETQFNEIFVEAEALKKLNCMEEAKQRSAINLQCMTDEFKMRYIREQEGINKNAREVPFNFLIENGAIASTYLWSESDHSDKPSAKFETLPGFPSKLEVERQDVQYPCPKNLDKIANLDAEIPQKEASNQLNGQILEAAANLDGSPRRRLILEETSQPHKKEIGSLFQTRQIQETEMARKDEELDNVNSCIQEKQLLLTQTLQSVQNLHVQSDEKWRKLALALQIEGQKLKQMEVAKVNVETELCGIKEDHCCLREQNVSSCMLIKNLQNDVCNLKEAKRTLEEELECCLDEKAALLQEVYSLKEELQAINLSYEHVIGQAHSVGLNEETIQSSVEELQNENSRLKEIHRKSEEETMSLLAKLADMEILLEKNSWLENSLSDANAELEGLRENLKKLEKSLPSSEGQKSALLAEKNYLVLQLTNALENMEKLSEKVTFLENSLDDVAIELDGFRVKSKSLEESCHSLQDENSSLLQERCNLVSQTENIQTSLDDLEKMFADLEDRNSCLEEEKELAFLQVSEFKLLLGQEKAKHENFVKLNKAELAHLAEHFEHLQEEVVKKKTEVEDEQEKVVSARMEIFVLHNCIYDMKLLNSTLGNENQKHIQAYIDSEKHMSELQQEICVQRDTLNSIAVQNKKLKHDVDLVFKSLPTGLDEHCEDIVEYQDAMQQILSKIKRMHHVFLAAEDEIHCATLEKFIITSFLEELIFMVLKLKSDNRTLKWKLRADFNELYMILVEKDVLLNLTKQLREDILSGSGREEVLKGENAIIGRQLVELQKTYQILAHEKFEDTLTMEFMALVYQHSCIEKVLHLYNELDMLYGVNLHLEKEHHMLKEKCQIIEQENLHFKEFCERMDEYRSHLVHLECELSRTKCMNEELIHEIGLGKDLYCQKETELLEVFQKLEAKEAESTAVHQNLQALREEIHEAKVVLLHLQKKIFMLSEDKIHQHEEVLLLCERNEKLEQEMGSLCDELITLKSQGKKLKSKLSEMQEVAEMWEMGAAEFYEDLHVFYCCTILIEEKICELINSYDREIVQRWGSEMLRKDAENPVLSVSIINACQLEEIQVLYKNKGSLEEEQGNLWKHFQKFGNLEEYLQSRLHKKMKKAEILETLFTGIYKDIYIFSSLTAMFERKAHEMTAEYGKMREKNCNAEMVVLDLQKQVLSLSEDKSYQYEELAWLRMSNRKLEAELGELQELLQEYKTREEYLMSRSWKTIEEAKMWELETAEICKNLYYFSNYAAVLERKVYELTGKYEKSIEFLMSELQKEAQHSEICETEVANAYSDIHFYCTYAAIFEEKSYELIRKLLAEGPLVRQKMEDDIVARDAVIMEFRRKIDALEMQNEDCVRKVTKPWSLVLSLKESLSVLEQEVLFSLHTVGSTDVEQLKDFIIGNQQKDAGDRVLTKDYGTLDMLLLSELHALQAKANTIKEAVMGNRKISEASAKVVVSDEEVCELKSLISLPQNKIQTSKDVGTQTDEVEVEVGSGKLKHEAEAFDIKMKDILLDRISNSACHEDVAHESRREVVEAYGGHMLKCGGTVEKISSLKPSSDLEIIQDVEGNSECQAEAELKIAELDSQGDEDGSMMTEEFASDAHRLKYLQAVVRELRCKIENLENQLTEFEHNNLKGQLKEVENAILGLAQNRRFRRQLVPEQARRESEIIQGLELMVQRIHLTLLQLEDNLRRKASKSIDRRARVILRDYLYGRRGGHHKRYHFCSCIRPQAREV